MIKYPFTTYFDQMWPTLEPNEKIKLYPHPELPLSCNQIGFLYFDNPQAYIRENSGGGFFFSDGKEYNIGTHSKLVYECYHSNTFKYARIIHLNCNQYDYTMDNLYLTETRSDDELIEYSKLKSHVTDSTVKYMVKKSRELEACGSDPELYWQLVGISKDLVKRWKVLLKREQAVYL